MNHNQAPLITGIPSQAELEQQAYGSSAEQASNWAPTAEPVASTGSFEHRQQIARDAQGPEDDGFDHATLATAEDSKDVEADPYLREYQSFTTDGEALQQVSLLFTDEKTGQTIPDPGWLVIGKGTGSDGQAYVKVAHMRSTTEKPREGYFTPEQLSEFSVSAAPKRSQELAELIDARQATANALDTREVAHDEYPAIDGKQAAELIAQVRAQQKSRPPQRYDAAGNPIFKR